MRSTRAAKAGILHHVVTLPPYRSTGIVPRNASRARLSAHHTKISDDTPCLVGEHYLSQARQTSL